MKIFEFSFNPKKRKNRFFHVYSYEPKNAKEKVRGSLYITGELDNALELNTKFLGRLSQIIQTEYYSFSPKTSLSALKAALKKANAFLKEENGKGNVDWLGNLHFAVLLFITVGEKKTMFHSTKTGSIKVSLTRKGVMTDVGKNLEKSASQLGTVFESVASGSLTPGDSVSAITKDVFDVFSKEKSLKELNAFNEAKQFHEFLKKRERVLKKISGILMSFAIEEEEANRSPVNRSLLPYLPLLRSGIEKQVALLKPRLMLQSGKKGRKSKQNKIEFSLLLRFLFLQKQVILTLLLLFLLLLGALFFG